MCIRTCAFCTPMPGLRGAQALDLTKRAERAKRAKRAERAECAKQVVKPTSRRRCCGFVGAIRGGSESFAALTRIAPLQILGLLGLECVELPCLQSVRRGTGFLIGWSFGGRCAQKVAWQMQQVGCQLPAVLLLDYRVHLPAP
ncbi:unnamed protein product [Symbiodinium natans]|uniref:Uncharacterized protein n=1 Tax=Symbiodinium natans TaxID=878477 RepID=A0A812J682_9DINO|nr:unnamed protein product [Symbiodinium natans]